MESRGIIRFLLVSVSLATNASSVFPSEIAIQMSKTYKNLADQFSEKTKESTPVLAILPFDTEAKLEKIKLGTAVAELLTHSFARGRKFSVVERLQLEKILKEQRLQLTGATPVENAVNIGRLLGAQYLLLGSALQVGDDYHINSRIISVESAEVLAADFVSLPARKFEQAAAPYLSLVPDRQTLGFYGAVSLWTLKVDIQGGSRFSSSSISSSGVTSFQFQQIPTELKKDFIYPGLGMRYFPVRWLFADLSGNFPGNSLVGSVALNPSSNLTVLGNVTEFSAQNPFNGSLNYANWFKRKYGITVGGGVSLFRVNYRHTLAALRYFPNGERVVIQEYSMDQREDFMLPYARLGFEWRPQQRVGVNFLLNYLITQKNFSFRSTPSMTYVDSSFVATTTAGDPTVANVSIGNEINFTAAVAFYF